MNEITKARLEELRQEIEQQAQTAANATVASQGALVLIDKLLKEIGEKPNEA